LRGGIPQPDCCALQVGGGRFSDGWFNPIEVVSLYWSLVDIVVIVLYPAIYLVARG
jgi:heme/copper-type cytochrome/quinol oxidase subunit 3